MRKDCLGIGAGTHGKGSVELSQRYSKATSSDDTLNSCVFLPDESYDNQPISRSLNKTNRPTLKKHYNLESSYLLSTYF